MVRGPNTATSAAEPRSTPPTWPAVAVPGRGPFVRADPDGAHGPTLDDAVREVLVEALGEALAEDRSRLVEETSDLYSYGDADEKRAVLRALPVLDIGDRALPLVTDALRTNDVPLVAAALGPSAVGLLGAEITESPPTGLLVTLKFQCAAQDGTFGISASKCRRLADGAPGASC
jgi:hypothetical protein